MATERNCGWPRQVVLLHGLTGSRRFFAGLEQRLRGAPTNAETLSFDLPGFGANASHAGGYGLGDHLTFISGAIDRMFPVGCIVLIGHSLGGVLALAWADQHRDRVSRIVLLNTPLGNSRVDVARIFLHKRLGWAALLLQHRRIAHVACLVLRGAQVIRAFRFAKPKYVPEDIFRDYTRHSWQALTQTFDRVLLSVPGGPLVRRIHEIPILNLGGEDDDAIARTHVEQSNVRNVTLPGGHLMLLEHPDSTAGAIEHFLETVRASCVPVMLGATERPT